MKIIGMKALRIQKFPAPVLRKKCEPVSRVTEEDRYFLKQMLDVMRRSRGIGLAAPQVGIAQRFIVADIGSGGIVLANPEIVQRTGADVLIEGCLSIPEAEVEIVRNYSVVVTGLNEWGKTVELKAQGLLARVLQHEIDHLDGKIILDYLSCQA